MSEGMSVFLPSNQAEIDEVVDIIPSILKREFGDDGNEKLTEDIYSGLYIRMSDMVSKVYGIQSKSGRSFCKLQIVTIIRYYAFV